MIICNSYMYHYAKLDHLDGIGNVSISISKGHLYKTFPAGKVTFTKDDLYNLESVVR